MLFTTDGRWNKVTDWWSQSSSARASSLCDEKKELLNSAKLSVFESVFVPILTSGHESWIMAKRILSQVQLSGRDEIFTNSSRRDTSWQSVELWNP